jgi:hypothetical protein
MSDVDNGVEDIPEVEYREPSVLTHAKRLYEAMLEQSYPEDEVHVFVGKVTELFRELGISTAYYSRIRRLLIKNGCIQIVKRGARGLGSEVRLYHPPEDFTIGDLTPTRNYATLILELDNRLRRLEGWRDSQGGLNTGEALRNHENRLSHLEADKQGKSGPGES